MKIQYSYNKSLNSAEPANPKKINRSGSSKLDSATTSAEVQLSPMTARMKAAESALGKSSSFDRRRVEELRTAITEGRFKINPEAIADRLLQSVGDLLGARSALESNA